MLALMQESFEAPQLAKATLPFSARHREHSQTLQDLVDISTQGRQ